MKCLIYKELLNWKSSSNRKPLLLQGARQVGKTYLTEQFANREYSDFVYLNFEQNTDIHDLFNQGLNSDFILENISLYLGKKISKDNFKR